MIDTRVYKCIIHDSLILKNRNSLRSLVNIMHSNGEVKADTITFVFIKEKKSNKNSLSYIKNLVNFRYQPKSN